MADSNAVMLAKNVRPSRYELTLTPDFEEFTFRGKETVHIEVLQPTDTIVLDCAEIQIESCTVTLADGSDLAAAETRYDKKAETVTFRFDTGLPAGSVDLELRFTGELNDKLRGFYRSKYTAEGGEERYLATTQFEATDARRAFPCWDEPAMKASFNVTLVIPSDLVAVSNMPIVSETGDGAGLSKKEFAETPVMSTYLLAFIVGDLKAIEQHAPGGTLVRVWTTPGKEEQGRFALETSVKLLEYFNDYFGIPYPLEKMDHLAVPDFAAGAMENWGAITYRETAILVDPEHSSAETRETVASVVAHEMAHMWFGDLVTMEWWNDLWLNESFASWMGDKAVDHLFPEWQKWTQFVSMDTNSALSLDGLQNSHPIEQEVKDPAEIGQLFDAISYSKGGSILRMLEHFLGAEAFQQGISRYLTLHKYGNARTTDLWDALGEASGQPVAAMMDTWVQQTGYPVLDVRTEWTEGGLEIAAEQRRFVYEHVVDPDKPDETLWRVPLSALSASGEETASELMDGRRARLRLDIPPGGKGDQLWVKLNPEQTGFYRVNYSKENWAALVTAIQELALSPIDRLGLQDDAYALTKAGFLPVTQFLSLAEAYTAETDASVWDDLAANLGGLDNLLSDEPYHPAFESFARHIFKPAGQRLGWDVRPGDGHRDALLRGTLLTELGGYGDKDTLGEAAARFAGYLQDESSVHPDIRDVVFDLAAKTGDRSTYDSIWELYTRADMEEEKVRFLGALSRFEDSDLLSETLDRSLSQEVRLHNTVRVVTAVASNRHGRDLAWEFLKDNWAELDRRYGEGGFGLMRLVSITSRFSTQEKLDDVQSFFESHPAPAAERTIRQSVERVRLNIAWLGQNREALARWFAT